MTFSRLHVVRGINRGIWDSKAKIPTLANGRQGRGTLGSNDHAKCQAGPPARPTKQMQGSVTPQPVQGGRWVSPARKRWVGVQKTPRARRAARLLLALSRIAPSRSPTSEAQETRHLRGGLISAAPFDFAQGRLSGAASANSTPGNRRISTGQSDQGHAVLCEKAHTCPPPAAHRLTESGRPTSCFLAVRRFPCKAKEWSPSCLPTGELESLITA